MTEDTRGRDFDILKANACDVARPALLVKQAVVLGRIPVPDGVEAALLSDT